MKDDMTKSDDPAKDKKKVDLLAFLDLFVILFYFYLFYFYFFWVFLVIKDIRG